MGKCCSGCRCDEPANGKQIVTELLAFIEDPSRRRSLTGGNMTFYTDGGPSELETAEQKAAELRRKSDVIARAKRAFGLA